MFILLSLTNFLLLVAAAVTGVLRWHDPQLYRSTQWARMVEVYGIGYLLTWPLALLAGMLKAALAANRKPTGERSMYCRKCGYILEGLVNPRCPECGQPFDPDNVVTFRRYPNDPRDWQDSAAWLWVIISGMVVGWFVVGLLKFMFP